MSIEDLNQSKYSSCRYLDPQEEIDLWKLKGLLINRSGMFVSDAELQLINRIRCAGDWYGLLQKASHAQIIHSCVPGYNVEVLVR